MDDLADKSGFALNFYFFKVFEVLLIFLELLGLHWTHLGHLKSPKMTFTKGRKWPKTRIINLTLPRQLCHFVISAENFKLFFGYFQTLCDKLGNHFSFFQDDELMFLWCIHPKNFGVWVHCRKKQNVCFLSHSDQRKVFLLVLHHLPKKG